jgi:hypothetical protein
LNKTSKITIGIRISGKAIRNLHQKYVKTVHQKHKSSKDMGLPVVEGKSKNTIVQKKETTTKEGECW